MSMFGDIGREDMKDTVIKLIQTLIEVYPLEQKSPKVKEEVIRVLNTLLKTVRKLPTY